MVLFFGDTSSRLVEPKLLKVDVGVANRPVLEVRFRYNLIVENGNYYLIRTRTLAERYWGDKIPLTIPAPTLVADRGYSMRFRLVNSNPDIDCSEGTDRDCVYDGLACDATSIKQSTQGTAIPNFVGLNEISLHMHGLHVDPGPQQTPGVSQISDNLFVRILPKLDKPKMSPLADYLTYQQPGQQMYYAGHGNYCVAIPGDHPRGNFWYHPHSAATSYMNGGLAGSILVTGCRRDGVPKTTLVFQSLHLCDTGVTEDVCIDNRVVALPLYRGAVSQRCEAIAGDLPGDPVLYVTNGKINPRFEMKSNERRIFCLTQAMHTEDMEFSIKMGDTDVEFDLISLDGIRFSVAQPFDAMMLFAGQTAEIVFMPTIAGEYVFCKSDQPMLTVTVTDESVEMAPLPRLRTPKYLCERALSLPWSGVLYQAPMSMTTLYSVYQENMMPVKVSRLFEFAANGINGIFDGTVAETMLAGTRELWRFSNTTQSVYNVHVQMRWFLVVAYASSTNNGSDPELEVPPVWLNTVAIPPGGYIDTIHPFADFTGKHFMYCQKTRNKESGLITLLESVCVGKPKIVNKVSAGLWEPPPDYVGKHGTRKPKNLLCC